MAKRKINGIESDAVFAITILGGGYLLLRHSLPPLFNNETPEDRAALDDQQTADPTDNIFDTAYPAYLQNRAQLMLPLMQQFGVDNTRDVYLTAYRMFLDGNLTPDNSLYQICLIYHQLTAAVSGHIFTGDQEAANQALNMITNKWQLGAITELWQDEVGNAWFNGGNFWHVLRYGTWPMIYGLNPSDLAAQVKRLNNLPD